MAAASSGSPWAATPQVVLTRAPGKLFLAGEYAVVEPGEHAPHIGSGPVPDGLDDPDLPVGVEGLHLAVQRFDHLPDGSRIHMEEFNQALGYAPRHKYGKGLQQDWPTMLRVLDRLQHQDTTLQGDGQPLCLRA